MPRDPLLDGAPSFSVLVLTCGALGVEVANRLASSRHLRSVVLVQCPWRTPRRSFRGKVRHVLRRQGPTGLLRVLWSKVASSPMDTVERIEAAPGVIVASFPSFDDAECLDYMKTQNADLGILAGTYILEPSVFDIPKLGSINLHTGKAPSYRGSAPAFWELFNGETEVGITIHQVSAELDAGAIFAQLAVPLDPVPAQDPIDYLTAVRRDTLIPTGIDLLVETVTNIAAGSATSAPQNPAGAHTYPYPSHRDVKELRRRVRERRRRGGIHPDLSSV